MKCINWLPRSLVSNWVWKMRYIRRKLESEKRTRLGYLSSRLTNCSDPICCPHHYWKSKSCHPFPHYSLPNFQELFLLLPCRPRDGNSSSTSESQKNFMILIAFAFFLFNLGVTFLYIILYVSPSALNTSIHFVIFLILFYFIVLPHIFLLLLIYYLIVHVFKPWINGIMFYLVSLPSY